MPNFAADSANVAHRLQKRLDKGRYQSGQMGQTVNLLAYAFGGSNPSLPTHYITHAEIAQSVEH